VAPTSYSFEVSGTSFTGNPVPGTAQTIDVVLPNQDATVKIRYTATCGGITSKKSAALEIPVTAS